MSLATTKQRAIWTTSRYLNYVEYQFFSCSLLSTASSIITYRRTFEAHPGVYIGCIMSFGYQFVNTWFVDLDTFF